MNKIKTITKNPTWSFVGVVLMVFFEGVRTFMFNHTLIQYFLIVIALLLAAHGFYRIRKQKQSRVYDILDDCVWDDTLGGYRNPITDELFCSDCWDDHKIKKHLKKDWSKWPLVRWICPRCNKIYTSPERALKSIFMKKPHASIIGKKNT